MTLELTESRLNPDEMEEFVRMSLWRNLDWERKTVLIGAGGTPEDPKITSHRLHFKGPNWFGHISIQIIGTKWRTHETGAPDWYRVMVYVRRKDGPMFRERNDRSENAVSITNAIKKGLEPPAPESLYPYLEAALDENAKELADFYADSGEAIDHIVDSICRSVIHYLKGAGILKEDLDPEAAMVESLFGPEDYEEIGKVAADLTYVTAWRRSGESAHRFSNLWSCDLRVPMRDGTYGGSLMVYPGTEIPWIMKVILLGPHKTRDSAVIGYFKTEPTPEALEKVREATLAVINRWMTGTLGAWGVTQMGHDIARSIGATFKGNPEILCWSTPYQPESIGDVDPEIAAWGEDYFKYEGIEDWEPTPGFSTSVISYHESSECKFKFARLKGHIRFQDYTYRYANGTLESTQQIGIMVIDSSGWDTLDAAYTSDKEREQLFWVPTDQFEAAKHALREFLAVYLKPLAIRSKQVIPDHQGEICNNFLKAMAPWSTVRENLEVDPAELWKEVEAHGGPPLQWKPGSRPGHWILPFNWLDGSHRGGIILKHWDNALRINYDVVLDLVTRNESELDTGYSQELYDGKKLELRTTVEMARFQDKMIAFALWLMRTYNRDNQIRYMSVRHLGVPAVVWKDYGRIMDEFSKACDVSKPVTEAHIDPEEFLKGFDMEGTMSPWSKQEHWAADNLVYVVWSATLLHRDRMRPFNDRVTLDVAHHHPGSTAHQFVSVTGMFQIRGWHEQPVRSTIVYGADGDTIRDLVDQTAREYLLSKVTANQLTVPTVQRWRRMLLQKILSHPSRFKAESREVEPELQLQLEAIPGLRFRSECRGFHHGQSDMTLYAELDGVAVGRIEYSVYNGQPKVQWIKTKPGLRREGIATAMAKQLQKEYPDTEIEWSGSTELGAPFLNSLDREFAPTPSYGELKRAYDAAVAERDALQAKYDAFSEQPTPEQQQELLLWGERFNELEQLIWSLEQQLRDLKPGRWLIREGMEMSPAEMEAFVSSALYYSSDWTSGPPYTGTFSDKGQDWILNLHTPGEQLSDNLVRLRIFDPRPEDGVQLALLTVNLTSPVWSGHQVAYYATFNSNRQFIIMPERAEDLRKAIESEFRWILEKPVNTLPPRRFSLSKLERSFKLRLSRLSRTFWVPGKVWM